MTNNENKQDKQNFLAFLMKDRDRIWSFMIYKKLFTPYEKEKKFIDENIYENGSCPNYGIVDSVHTLPDGDILIGFKIVYDCDDYKISETTMIEYYKLSEIRLSYNPAFDIDDSFKIVEK